MSAATAAGAGRVPVRRAARRLRTGVRRRVIELSDRPLGRPALAALATWHARRSTGLDVDVRHDGVWVHRIGDTFVPVSDRFEYRRDWATALDALVKPIEDNWFHVYRPRAGDTIVDVGAGDGLDSLVFSRAVGPSGTVVAVEAHPTTFALLRQTCRLNGLSNVTPLQCAVTDSRGPVTLVEADDHRDMHSMFGAGGSSGRRLEVPGVGLDDLYADRGLDAVDFLKMNIEGAERLALARAHDALARTRHVCIACHDFMSARSPELATRSLAIDVLRSHGFDVVTRDDSPQPWVRDHVHGVRR